MASIENTRLYRETVRAILEDWDNIMKRDGTDTCPICYRREYMSEASADQAGYRDDFCELCDEIFPEIVKARSVNDRSGPCPCFVLKDEAAVISRACAYVDDPEKEV